LLFGSGVLCSGSVNSTIWLVMTLCVGPASSNSALCGPGFRAGHDHRFAAGVDEVPRRVVDGDVDACVIVLT
jgi:hypothetical protein